MASTSPYQLRSKDSKPSPRKPIKQRHHRNSVSDGDEENSEDESIDSINKSYDELDSTNTSQNMSGSPKSTLNSSIDDISNSAKKRPVAQKKHKMEEKADVYKRSTTPPPTPLQTEKMNCKGSAGRTNNDNARLNCFHYILIAVIPLVLGVYIYVCCLNGQTGTEVQSINIPALIDAFRTDMKLIKDRFPAQTSKFWKIVQVSLKRIIQEPNPDYPAVLLLVVPSGHQASQTGTCIAKQLTKIINTLFNVTSAKVIDINNDIGHRSPDDEKKELDNQIKESFENGHYRSIAVDHFEQLSPRASLLFHGYCDGDNAPFKNVAIVFILHTQMDKESLHKDPTLIDKHLIELWSGSEFPLDRDKIDPLIARVANNAAVITEEDNLTCK